jgi:uncharacterized protein (DUF58 family)
MGDPFGLVQRRLAEPEPAELLVYPRVVALDRLGLPAHSALALLAAPHRLLEDPSRIRGIRDYQPTDSPRRIHWTASARLGRLSVKQYQPAFARDTLLCLDLSPAGYEGPGDTGIEMAIVVAASLAVHIAERERLAVGLATRVREGGPGEYRSVLLPPAEGLAHAATILEALARARPVSAGGLAAVLDEQRDTVRWGTTVVGITGSLSPELADALVTIKARGHPTSCIVAQPPERFTAPQLGTGWPVAWPRGVALHRVWTVPELASVA